MKLSIRWLALPLACLTVMPIAGAAEAVTPAERDAIVATARDAAAKSLKLEAGRLHLVPEQLQRRADWVFLTTQMQDAAGKRFDYTGTDQAEAARHAKAWLERAIAAAGQLQVGSGHGPVHHFHALWPKPQD